MANVFVSHASEDGECADQLHQWLVAEGHEVFLDQDLGDGIAVGEEWDKRLHERLRWADAVVCVVTSVAVASTWCSAEVGIALSRGSRLLPVRAEPGVDHPLLTSAQYADLTRDPTAARAALVESLRRVDAAGGLGWPDDRSPYPGLRPFDVGDHRVFFGRSGEVDQLAGLLRSPAERVEGAVLLVVGPSGCGKSSLVRSGLLHVMAEEPGWWTSPPILPGADPVATLVRELAATAQRVGLSWTVAQVRHQLDDTGLTGLVDELLLAVRARRLLLVVDQFEELLTQASPGQRARFAQLLYPALSGPVQVVATLRPEFVDQLLVDADLAVLPTRPYMLRPLRREALRAVIEGPARLAGIAVDDNLVTRLVTDTDTGEALPLLAFTLAQLADNVCRGGQLSGTRYDQLGGVQGALTRQADAALADAIAATKRRREEIIAGLLRLVTVDEQGRPIRWRVSRTQLPEQVTREVDVFVGRRLLTTDTDTDSDNVVVGVAHEAFLSAWPPLAQAIEENVSALRARRAIEQAATEWDGEGRPPARLWERGQLAAAVTDTGAHLRADDLVTDRVELSPTARIFLRASLRRDRFRRKRAITVLSVMLVFAVLAAGYAFAQQRIAVGQRDIALSRQVAGAALALRSTNPALAAQLGLAAYRLAPTSEARGSLLSTFGTPYATQLTGHTGAVYAAVFGSNGHTLATSSIDQTVRLWDVTDLHHPNALVTVANPVDRVAPATFSPDGRILATSSANHTARLWDVSDPHHPNVLATLTGHTDTIRRLAFNPDGHTLATASSDHTARLWDVTDPRHPEFLATLTGHLKELTATVFSPDGNTVATVSADSSVRLWDIIDRRHPRPLPDLIGHTDRVLSAAFSPDRRILATGSFDNTIRLWDVANPQHPGALTTLTGHTGGIAALAFSADGHTLATGSYDDTVRLWDVTDPRKVSAPVTLSGHAGTVYSVSFSPDGNTLATASGDNTARLWDIRGPVLTGHYGEVNATALSPNGQILATGTFLTARLWDVTDPDHPSPLATLTGHTDNVSSVAFSPDGRTLATASLDFTVRLWDVANPHQPTVLATLTGHTNNVNSVAFSPDGHTLASGGADHTARLWDVANPHQPAALATLTGHTNNVSSVAFSPDGHTLASGGADHTARLWDVANPHQPAALATLTGHTNNVSSVAFSPDGHTLASGGADHTARLWDVANPHQPAALATLTGHTNNVNSVAFSPDGHTLLTGAFDNTARLWDVTDWHHPGLATTLTGHTEKVYSVAFSPNGHTVATSSADHTARLWDTDIARTTQHVCAIAYPSITRAEWSQYLPDLGYQPPCQ